MMNCFSSCTSRESMAALVSCTMMMFWSILASYFSVISCSLSMATASFSELSFRPPMWKTRKNTPQRMTTLSARMMRV